MALYESFSPPYLFWEEVAIINHTSEQERLFNAFWLTTLVIPAEETIRLQFLHILKVKHQGHTAGAELRTISTMIARMDEIKLPTFDIAAPGTFVVLIGLSNPPKKPPRVLAP